MSFDFFLHKRNKQARIRKSDLELLENRNIKIDDIQNDETGDVTFFTAAYKDSPFSSKYEFSLQETGEYWTYTYNYDEEDFSEFTMLIETLGKELFLLIDNPQTGQIDLKPEHLFNEQMKKFLEIQQSVVKNIPTIIRNSDIDIETTKTDIELYDEYRSKLITIYEPKGYYVDNVMWGQKEGTTKFFCSWIVNVPTVLPPVNQVIVLESADENSPAYLLDIDILEKSLGKNMQVVTGPVLHYLVEAVETQENKEALFKLGRKLK